MPAQRGLHRTVAGVAAALLVCLAPTSASAQRQVDLPGIVLRQVDGYQPAPGGVRPSGPLTDDELARFTPEARRRGLVRTPASETYGRTFVGGGQRRAVVIGFLAGTVARARSFVAAERERALDQGGVFPVTGVPHAFRVAVRPERSPGASTQQIFMQSGPLVFAIVLSDISTAPVTDAHAIHVARAQARAVPKALAAQEDESTADDIAREVRYAVGFVAPIALVVGTVTVWRRRR